MNHPTNQQILRLYKNLLKYGEQLQLTDKCYYMNRIRQEFKENKKLKTAEEIEFSFKVNVAGYLAQLLRLSIDFVCLRGVKQF